MDQPLGRTVGNALEVQESLEILQSRGPWDVRALVIEEAAHMALSAGLFADLPLARQAAAKTLDDGSALAKFRQMVIAQGGRPDEPLPEAKVRLPVPAPCDGYVAHVDAEIRLPVPAPCDGYVAHVDAETIGRVALELGAGRVKVTDTPDPAAGLDCLLQQGERVDPGQPICFLCADTEERAASLIEKTRSALTLAATPPPERLLIAETIVA